MLNYILFVISLVILYCFIALKIEDYSNAKLVQDEFEVINTQLVDINYRCWR